MKYILIYLLRIKNENAIYEDILSVGQPKSHVLFKSNYINDTVNEQEYQLRTERKTVSTCDIEIFEGYVTEVGAELKLEIPIPGCVLEGGSTFKYEYAIENTTTKSIEEEITWSVDSNIRVNFYRYFLLSIGNELLRKANLRYRQ